MKKLLTILLLLTCGICSGQNLIPNGDFEQYYGCPIGPSQIDSTKFWFRPTGGTSDYYNQCATFWAQVPNTYFGFQQAQSGVAYAGIYIYYQPSPSSSPTGYREYIETPLNSIEDSSLIANKCYHFEMYINLGNIFKYTSYNIGVYFSDTSVIGITNYVNLPFVPQINNTVGNYPDTLNWTTVSGNYTAHGGESYLIIGNFDSDLSIDTLNVNSSTGTMPCSYFHIDDVSLVEVPCDAGIEEHNESIVTIYPNPVIEKLTVKINNNEPYKIILYDLSSRKLLQQTFRNTTTINTEQLAKGMYLYEVRNKNGIIKNGKLIKE